MPFADAWTGDSMNTLTIATCIYVFSKLEQLTYHMCISQPSCLTCTALHVALEEETDYEDKWHRENHNKDKPKPYIYAGMSPAVSL